MSKPFVEDLHETPEERARLEAEKNKILCQLSKDAGFDLSRARKIGTIGDQQSMWKIAVSILMHYWKHENWSNKLRCMSRNLSLI